MPKVPSRSPHSGPSPCLERLPRRPESMASPRPMHWENGLCSRGTKGFVASSERLENRKSVDDIEGLGGLEGPEGMEHLEKGKKNEVSEENFLPVSLGHTPSGNLYEFPLLRRITGNTLRPGGVKITGQALTLCDFSAGAKLLDVGCGAGASLRFFTEQGLRPVGLDTSLSLLAEAQQYAPVVLGDAQALPFGDAIFQGVFCECVVSLLPRAEAFFKEANRVLADGGWLVLSDIVRTNVPEPKGVKVPLSERNCLGGAKSREMIQQLVHENGFALRHIFDCKRYLTELAAKMVWEFGSMDAFWALWRENTPAGCRGVPCAQELGYDLFIGQKIAKKQPKN